MPPSVRALAQRNYRLYFLGQLVSLTGNWMQQVALIWLTYRITDSTFMLGLITFSGQVPLLVLSPLGGVLSDRLDRRTLLLRTQWLALCHAMLLATLAFTVPLQAWTLVCLATLLGLINGVDQPVRQSFVAELVEKAEDIPNAVALNSVVIHATRFVGPAIGGIVVGLVGERMCFLLNALSFLGMIAALRAIRPRAVTRHRHRVLEALRSGFQYTYAHQHIRALLFIVMVMGFFGMAPITLLPWFAKKVFAGDAQAFGFLTAAAGIGSCIGALFLASRRDAAVIDRNISRCTLIAALAVLAFSFTSPFWLAVTELMVLGFCTINVVSASNALIHLMVDDQMRGRVMSIFTVAFFGIAPVGSLAAGTASQVVSPRTALLVCAVLIFAAGAFVRFALKPGYPAGAASSAPGAIRS
ncbi:MAG TPA: MFS transporter [Steroidobacteraceae bacterium]|jgi:MFS family permease|nr:MFS transporter [Steroidobacteraceae bacterium]